MTWRTMNKTLVIEQESRRYNFLHIELLTKRANENARKNKAKF